MKLIYRFSWLKSLLCSGLLAATGAQAQTPAALAAWPVANKTISIVSAYPAGGSSDVLARAIGEKLTEKFKVPVIVENKAGGGGQIAAAYIKQQAADGHTIWLGDIGPFVTNQYVYKKLNYDMRKDFTALAKLVDVPVFLVVPTNSPFKTLDDLIKESKTRPNGLNYGSQGPGLGGHIYGELFKREVQGNFNHVPYKGSMPGLMDLIGGQIDLMHDNVLTSGPLVKDGKVRALAVRATHRVTQFPGVPTMPELGLGNINHVLWFGAVVKADTPPAVVKKISQELIAAIRHPDVAKRFTDMGLEISTQSPEEFQKFLGAEQDKWSRLIRETKITLD
ncbi:tripartite tricarboxylate transporter substrate binding protein [Polaromonas hydrogenivorans]|uniref:Tripartite tricarboxylate transporter substrate binding protein n=1 Tax=Polaromonas hydrogenivorans TaxID=335476 RepID=A0AAU7LNN9_9BURK